MALAILLFAETRSRCSRSQAANVSTSGLDFSRRTARRCSGARPLISRSISKSSSMRRTASQAIGAFVNLASSKNFSPPVSPTGRFRDRRGSSSSLIEFVVSGISVGLHDPAVTSEMPSLIWTKSANDIIVKVNRGRAALKKAPARQNEF
jgi:hypothetical protein